MMSLCFPKFGTVPPRTSPDKFVPINGQGKSVESLINQPRIVRSRLKLIWYMGALWVNGTILLPRCDIARLPSRHLYWTKRLGSVEFVDWRIMGFLTKLQNH